ncbi:MAG: glutathione S-transferase family protein [Usitatibacteraceae bacterium]
MLKIWGRLTSVNVQKVVWCADELGVKYERIEAGGKHGIVTTPEYRAMNPNSLVPVIDDDGFVLWESNAIVRYLAAKYGEGTLWPSDVRVRADADRWMDWQAVSLNPSIGPAFLQLVRTAPEKRDAGIIENARAEVEKKLAILDTQLATREYVTGSGFTMGDIPIACSVDRWYKLPLIRETHSNVERWFKTVSARKGAQQVVQLALA